LAAAIRAPSARSAGSSGTSPIDLTPGGRRTWSPNVWFVMSIVT
jgi:hypothetical protein